MASVSEKQRRQCIALFHAPSFARFRGVPVIKLTERKLPITKEQNGGKPCVVKTGDTKPCKVDCKLSEWTDDWSQCSRRCGGGEQTKTRSVIQKPKNGGAACGNTTMTQSCNTQPCTERPLNKTTMVTYASNANWESRFLPRSI